VQLPAKDAAAVEQYLTQIRQSGLQAQDIEIRRPDLEDVFLKVMQQHPGRDDRSPA
jgi:ABC-2 type transport system ATP-binding protein